MLRTFLGGLALLGVLHPLQATAQDYPDGTVTMVVPFSAGGSNDTIARYLAQQLSILWDETFIVENRAGGGTAVGAAHVANSDPDGQTVLFVSGSYSINAASRADLPFDPVEDLDAVALVARGDIGVISAPDSGIGTLDDLVRVAGEREIFYATAGVGSQQHFFAELLADALDIKMTPVPYPGGAEGLVDLLGGRVDIVVGTVSGMLATIENGANPVAVMSAERVESMPDTQTAAEAGYPEAETQTYWALFTPAGTPREIMEKLNAGVSEVVESEEGVTFLRSLDASPGSMGIDEIQTYIADEIAYWTQMAEDIGVRAAN